MAVQKVKCNLVPSLATPVTVNLHQFDKTADSEGKVIEVELYNGKELYTVPADAKAIIRAANRIGPFTSMLVHMKEVL